jgi:hypothetical protein
VNVVDIGVALRKVAFESCGCGLACAFVEFAGGIASSLRRTLA